MYEMVLISNKPKTDDFPDHLVHFIDLSTPRPIVYTEDSCHFNHLCINVIVYIIQCHRMWLDNLIVIFSIDHAMALNYVYYDIYTQMIEMTRDLEL
jgi:hypothetical protein